MLERSGAAAVDGGAGLPRLPVDRLSASGARQNASPLTKIQRVSAQNLHRAWVSIPHVTQFDEADITELEAFRVAQKDATESRRDST
jgi:pyruvate dehydrogenase E2 component (dihydrolipoamide acetyltransferase)